MKFQSIQEAMKKGSGKVSIRGWVHRERGSNKLKFIVLRDVSNIIQCILKRDQFEKDWDEIDKVQIETAMEIVGEIKKDERAPTGYEIQVKEFQIVGKSDNYPIAKDQSVEFLADNRHLWLRSRKMTAILKIRSTVFGAIDEYFKKEKFYEYHSPVFQSVQCEGGSTLFNVPYYGKKGVFLGQTWQLYAEPAIFGLEKIYTISPSFRAEKSRTSRHLTEYWHAEMEAAWINFDELQDYAENLIKYIFKKVIDNHKPELELLERDLKFLKPIIEKSFKRMTYTEALEILDKKCGMRVAWGKDLRTVEEDKLTSLYDVPVIVTRYPKEVKAFYMTEDPEDPRAVLGFDLLAPEGHGEIIGASDREPDIEKIKQRLKEDNEDPKEYTFYLDTRKYGSVPHAGFGLGVERVIKWICGLDNIKDTIPFPRTMERYRP